MGCGLMGGGRIFEFAALAKALELEKYLNNPVKAYTHTTNLEVAISSVDTLTDTFTCNNHGLNNGDRIYPVMNYNSGNIYPIDKYPGGISYVAYPGYYVVNKTANTFQLSLTNGGAAIDITANANLDLTKWHFEKIPDDNLILSDIPSLYKIKAVIKGRSLQSGSTGYILPNSLASAQEWMKPGTSTFTYGYTNLIGDISIDGVVTIDFADILTENIRGLAVKSSTASANTATFVNTMINSPKYRNTQITSLLFANWALANRSTIEIYKA